MIVDLEKLSKKEYSLLNNVITHTVCHPQIFLTRVNERNIMGFTYVSDVEEAAYTLLEEIYGKKKLSSISKIVLFESIDTAINTIHTFRETSLSKGAYLACNDGGGYTITKELKRLQDKLNKFRDLSYSR